jgi:hypothetical protein
MPVGVDYGYFGTLTQSALARWQVARGIAPALGYFGPLSRIVFAQEMSQLSKLSASQVISSPALSVSVSPSTTLSNSVASVTTDSPIAMGMRAGQIMLFRTYPFEVRSGDLIILEGSGFSRTLNKVYFNSGYPVVATSTDGVTLRVLIPSELSEGEYQLSATNVFGSSDQLGTKISIKVTNNPQLPPRIESATLVGDTVSLVGSGFTSANNLFTTLGDSSGSITADGNSLTFRVTDLSRYEQTKIFTKGKYQVALWIFVQNEHGMNRAPYRLNITI